MAQQPHPVTEYKQIEVTITYSLKNPADGVQFVLPSEAYPTVSKRHVIFATLSDLLQESTTRFHDAVFT